jgi:hypothetical protein
MHIPTGLLASVVACKNGVKRAHLVSAYIDGGLILELYSRDGVGTMISSDFYEVTVPPLFHTVSRTCILRFPLCLHFALPVVLALCTCCCLTIGMRGPQVKITWSMVWERGECPGCIETVERTGCVHRAFGRQGSRI